MNKHNKLEKPLVILYAACIIMILITIIKLYILDNASSEQILAPITLAILLALSLFDDLCCCSDTAFEYIDKFTSLIPSAGSILAIIAIFHNKLEISKSSLEFDKIVDAIFSLPPSISIFFIYSSISYACIRFYIAFRNCPEIYLFRNK